MSDPGGFDAFPDEPPDQPDAGNPADVRRRAREQRRIAKEDREFEASLFSTPAGRRFLYRLLDDTGALKPPRFSTGPNGFPQPDATFYLMGQRDLGTAWYHRWAIDNRADIFAMLDENDPNFKRKSR